MHDVLQVLCGSAKTTSTDTDDTAQPLVAFVDRDDSYDLPSLSEEADEMMQVSFLIYTVTDLRSLAKKGKVARPEKILDLPLTFGTALDMIAENVDLIKRVVGEADHAMKLSALTSIRKRYEQNATSSGVAQTGWTNPYYSTGIGISSPYLVAYGDDDPDKGTVYAVAVDPMRKRVTVAFRGSATPRDLLADVCFGLKRRPNPLPPRSESDETDDRDETIGVHRGFHRYLLHRGDGDGSEGRTSKYDEIMPHLLVLFGDPIVRDYKLYVTGHSLGGALATLFAFETAASAASAAAASGEGGCPIPTPITCVTVGSPRVGDATFQRAFRFLETRGTLRHLRVVNDGDPVTALPVASSKRTWVSMLGPISCVAMSLRDTFSEEKELYRHTGIKLTLFKDGRKPYELRYSGASREKGGMCHKLLGVTDEGVRVAPYHYGHAYCERLARAKDGLANATLNDLYGTLLPAFSTTERSRPQRLEDARVF